MVGEWEVVAPPPPPLPADGAKQEEDTKLTVLTDGLSQKRDADIITNDEDDGRQFKFRKRKLNVGLDEIWDPGDIPIKLKSKLKPEPSATVADPLIGGTTISGSCDVSANVTAGTNEETPEPGAGTGEGKPKWKPMGWKLATENGGSSADIEAEGDDLNAKTTLSSTVEDRPIMDGKGVTVAMDLLDSSLALSPGDALDVGKGKMKEEDPPSGAGESSGLFRKRKRPIGGQGRR